MFFQEAGAQQENSVGQLQELATKRKWAPPQYEEMGFTGKPHERVFAIKCTLKDVTAIGYGPKKKIAKRRAAKQLLEEEPISKKKKNE